MASKKKHRPAPPFTKPERQKTFNPAGAAKPARPAGSVQKRVTVAPRKSGLD